MPLQGTRLMLIASLLIVAASPRAQSDGVPITVQARYLSAFENAVLTEQNLVRTDPLRYAGYVEEWLGYYRGRRRRLPGRRPVVTTEGKKAVEEAVLFLQAQDPLPALAPSRGLSRAARDHVRDTGPRGTVGHVGTDGSEPGDRANRHGTWDGRVGENITYGGSDAREFVIRLIIDDGIPDRGHRRNIFNHDYRVAGASFGDHRGYGTMCVMTFAERFEENGHRK